MSRMKLAVVGLLLAAFTGVATAQTPYAKTICDPANPAYKPGTAVVKTIIAGSSAMWNTFALGAYNQGKGPTGAIANTHHWVGTQSFNIVDTRPTALGGTAITDSGQIWIVWDEHTAYVPGTGTVCAPDVWAYVNTDSVVGNRSVLGSIGTPNATVGNFGIYVEAPAAWGTLTGNGNTFLAPLWTSTVSGASNTDETQVPDVVQKIFTNTNEGVANAPNLVNVGATDIRPEDAYFAITRANSKLGGTSVDARDGLGYVSGAATGPNSSTSGAAPGYNPACGTTPPATKDDLVGQKIQGFILNKPGGSASSFNVAAFNLTGFDPFTCAVLPALHTIPVGAVPIVFIRSNQGPLATLTNANEVELGSFFSGSNTNANAFHGLTASVNVAAVLREALSGTMNTTEATVFRHPSSLATYRQSQESNIDPSVATYNPLNHVATGGGMRYRAIGTGRAVASVQYAADPAYPFIGTGSDVLAYTFFSYGNVAPLAGLPNARYITLNSVDPIWHNYVPGTAGITDPGQPATPGALPGASNNPAGCSGGPGHFPCNENQLWQKSTVATLSPTGAVTTFDSYSFPNLRNGSYAAWSVVRLVAGAAYLNAQTLVNSSQTYVVNTVPDYVPFNAVKTGTYPNYTYLDAGLTIVRSHYGCLAITCGYNYTGTVPNTPSQGALERGRDAGGAILPIGDIKVNYTQDAPNGLVVFQ